MPRPCSPAATRSAAALSSRYVSRCDMNVMAMRSGVTREGCSSTDARFRLATLGPLRVHEAGAFDPLVLVRAERVTLRLGEVLRQARRAIAVEIGEAGGQRGDGDACSGCGGHDTAPSRCCVLQIGRDSLVHEQVRQ